MNPSTLTLLVIRDQCQELVQLKVKILQLLVAFFQDGRHVAARASVDRGPLQFLRSLLDFQLLPYLQTQSLFQGLQINCVVSHISR